MKKSTCAFTSIPLVAATLLAGVVMPQAANADTLLSQYKWSADTPYFEYGLGDFTIESATHGSKLVFQTDGNLVLYNNSGRALWQSHTYARGAAKLSFQSDGNVDVYRADNVPLWASGVTRSMPSSVWSIDLAGSPSSPTVAEHNWLTGSTSYWHEP